LNSTYSEAIHRNSSSHYGNIKRRSRVGSKFFQKVNKGLKVSKMFENGSKGLKFSKSSRPLSKLQYHKFK